MDTPPTAVDARVPRATNRRRGDRHRLDIPATLATADGSIPAVVTAFSVNGVGLRVGRLLAVGDEFALHSFDTLIPPGLRVRVRSHRVTPAGDHEVGAEVI